MIRPTFDELLQKDRGNAWVKEPGFVGLYVRIGQRLIGGEHVRTIDLANFEVRRKGRGVFSRFVKKIEKYQLPIFVENVLSDRFANFLQKTGFVRDTLPLCFLKQSHIIRENVIKAVTE